MCLNDLRKKIDDIDQQIVKLLDQRMQLCAMIGQIKKQKDLPVENIGREEEILNNIRKSNLTHTNHIQSIMLSILNESKDLQNTL